VGHLIGEVFVFADHIAFLKAPVRVSEKTLDVKTDVLLFFVNKGCSDMASSALKRPAGADTPPDQIEGTKRGLFIHSSNGRDLIAHVSNPVQTEHCLVRQPLHEAELGLRDIFCRNDGSTPSSFMALEISIDLILAWAMGLRRIFP
jgi:hypothetical protein